MTLKTCIVPIWCDVSYATLAVLPLLLCPCHHVHDVLQLLRCLCWATPPWACFGMPPCYLMIFSCVNQPAQYVAWARYAVPYFMLPCKPITLNMQQASYTKNVRAVAVPDLAAPSSTTALHAYAYLLLLPCLWDFIRCIKA